MLGVARRTSEAHAALLARIDVCPAQDFSVRRQRFFALPLTLFSSRKSFPWFLLPEKHTSIALCCPFRKSAFFDYLEAISAEPYLLDDPFDGDQNGLFLRFINHLRLHGWSVAEVWFPLEEVDSSLTLHVMPRSVQLPYSTCVHFARCMAMAVSDLQSSFDTLSVLDLGCGAGRDAGFLLHQYHHIPLHIVAVDSWKGSCDRVHQLVSILGEECARRVTIVRAQLMEHGNVKFLPWKPITFTPKISTTCCNTNPLFSPTMIFTQTYALIILSRFLPARNWVHALHAFLAPGSILFLSTFYNYQNLSINEWTRQHQSPSTYDNLLTENELTRDLNPLLLGKSTLEIYTCIEQWGWGFNSINGYSVLVNELQYLSDGRPILCFLVQKTI